MASADFRGLSRNFRVFRVPSANPDERREKARE